MNEILVSIIMVMIFLLSIILRVSFVLVSILIGSLIAILNSFYNFNFSIEGLSIFSETAISFIFFSLGLGYTIEAFISNLKKSLVSSLFDLFNLFIPFVILYIITKDFFLSFILGICLYPSSTAIVVKILEFQKKLVSKAAEIMIGILLFEDIILIMILSILSLYSLSQNKSPIITIILTIVVIILIFFLSKFVINRYSPFLERYIQEEIGIFFILGYFLLLYSLSKILHLPEVLIMFFSSLFISQNVSNSIRPKLEPLKNFSIGLFILDFMSKTKLNVEVSLNYTILLLIPLFTVLKILTTYWAFKYSKIKFKKEDIIFFLPRGEFSAYISKFANIEIFAFISILLSNIIVLINKISLQRKTTSIQKK
ncbi:MAG: cation:proton antiporter [bacterium]|nr:cation:proton antiporter [bacterium]